MSLIAISLILIAASAVSNQFTHPIPQPWQIAELVFLVAHLLAFSPKFRAKSEEKSL